jgi:hypothetical protein
MTTVLMTVMLLQASAPGDADAAQPLPWGPATEADITGGGAFSSVSCVSVVNCTAVGNAAEDPFTQDQPLSATETNGTWGPATSVDIAGGGNLSSVSCSSAGDCTAVGNNAQDPDQPFYVSQTNGTWGPATVVDILGGGTLSSVSCSSAGDCTAVGNRFDQGSYAGVSAGPISVTETNGAWGPVTPLSDLVGGLLSSASCTSAGNCTAVGNDAQNQPIYVNQTNGTWGSAAEVLMTVGGAFSSVSCTSAGNCTGVGEQGVSNVPPMGYEPFSATETNGIWGPVSPVNNLVAYSEFTSVSCTSAGNCTGIGRQFASPERPFFTSETNGTWGPAAQVNNLASDTLDGVSCTSAGNCTAVGEDAQIQPIYVTATAAGHYWLVGSDGGIFSYGDAGFFGSHGGSPLNSPVVGMAS